LSTCKRKKNRGLDQFENKEGIKGGGRIGGGGDRGGWGKVAGPLDLLKKM